LIDLYNQRNYQNLFREDNSSEPFVGAICAPYDPKLPKSISAFNWFYVGNGDEDKNRPKQLRYDIEPFKIDNEEMMKLVDLIVECGSRSDCVDFGQGWRKDRWESKLEKLKASVESHFVQGDAEFHSFWSIVEREISKWSQNVEE
jgi:hypothetical protein